MNYIIHLVVFIIVLIAYLHIQSHFRSAPGSEVFELDGVIESRIDDVLNLKQPVVFRTCIKDALEEEVNMHTLLQTSPDTDVSVVETETGTRVTSSAGSFAKLQQTANATSYYSDGNEQVINGLSKETRGRIAEHHRLMVPPLVCTTRYDIMFGTHGGRSSMRRHVAHQTYFTVTNGTVVAKLTHPDDLVDMEFSCKSEMTTDSMTSVLISTQNTSKEKDVTLYKGQTLFVPPYWGITFQFTKDTFILAAKYSTYITEVATCAHSARFWYNKMVDRPKIVPDLHVPRENTETLSSTSSEQSNECSVIPSIDTEIVTVTPKVDNTNPETKLVENLENDVNEDAPNTVLTPIEHLASL